MSGYAQDNIRLPPKWIALNLSKRECSTFIPVAGDLTICQCGRRKIDHGDFVKFNHRADKWSPLQHTKDFPTDAYGTILFEGEHHPNKAHYVRLSYDTNAERVMHLMRYVWGLPMPKLVISVHGGSLNFDLSTRLGKVFQTGIINVAQTTSAWVLSSGLNAGVSKHLGNALNNHWVGGYKHRNVVSIGIAPWGMCEHRMDLIGWNKERIYSPLEVHNSNMIHLNPRHSNFLLVDNGSVGKFGGEIFLRRKLEKCISTYPLSQNGNCANCTIPVVAIIMEGGGHTLRLISEYLYDDPPVPIILFSGTGKVTDLVAWMLKRFQTIEEFQANGEDIKSKIERIFHLGYQASSEVFQELKQIYQRKILITVYNGNSASEEKFDTVILSSICRSQHWSPLEQLELTLVWNRVDLAKYEVFVYGREWSRGHLEEAMMEALVSNRLEFVELLMEHGINMQTFLTASRLEALYSLERIPSKILRSLLTEFSQGHAKSKLKASCVKKQSNRRDLTLHDIGIALSHMIGHVYQSSYIHIVAKIHKSQGGGADEHEIRAQTFLQPFDDLFIWAVLTKRHEMSKLLWRHGKGALAKALLAVKLNRYMACEINAAEKTVTSNFAVDFENYAEEWETLSVSLLDSCYRANAKMARQLLTMELESWSKQTCLTLAVLANHRSLLGHSCCQILLGDLWMGALNIKSNTTLKIILGILFPPLAVCWEYKSREELRLLPHQEKTGHPYGVYSTTNMNQLNHDQYTGIPHGDPESFIKPRQGIAQNAHAGAHERTTDLAIVARSIFPLSIDANNAQNGEVKENGDGILASEPHHFPHLVKVSERGTDISHDHFHFKLRNISHSEDFETATAAGKFDRSSFVTTQQSLGLWRKFVEFQTAPITNYVRHTIGYFIFVIAFVYIVIYTQNPRSPGWVEWYVIAYFITQFLECIREFIHIDALNFSEKLSRILHNVWPLGDFITVIACLGAVALRLTGNFEYAMLIYRISSPYWNFRLYKYLGVHRFIGPKLSMMRRMMKHMIHFAMIIFVVIISFGIARKAIRTSASNPTLKELAEAFLEPYMMMFGEVDDLESLSAHCGQADADSEENTDCPHGYWIVPIAWTVYMFVSNILIVNVLIAVFNGIYEEVDAIAVEVWMSQRFNSVMEFERKPILPPPLIIICHVISVIKCLYENSLSCICEEELLLESQLDEDVHPHIIMGNDQGLKSFLSLEEQSMVFDFEEENVDNLTPLLEKESTVGVNSVSGSIGGTPSYINNNPVSTDTNVANRLGIGNEKFVVQQMKFVIGELHSELESQKLKLDKLINCWELEIASGNPDAGNANAENSGKGNYCQYCNEADGDNVVVCSEGRNISTTSSIDEFS